MCTTHRLPSGPLSSFGDPKLLPDISFNLLGDPVLNDDQTASLALSQRHGGSPTTVRPVASYQLMTSRSSGHTTSSNGYALVSTINARWIRSVVVRAASGSNNDIDLFAANVPSAAGLTYHQFSPWNPYVRPPPPLHHTEILTQHHSQTTSP